MSDAKKADIVFDPQTAAFRYKLWVKIATPAGTQWIILWRRVAYCLIALLIVGWLAAAGAAWGFVKYKRQVSEVSYLDVAFYPLRRTHYHETLAQHHFATAKAQLEKQAWSEALLSLRVALGHAPRDLEIRRLLAELYALFKRPELARQTLEGGLPYVGQDAAYLRQTFGYLRAQRQTERVITLGNALLPATPDNLLPHRVTAFQVALACLELKRYDEAENLVTRWQLDKANEGQILLADLAVARGFPELAINRYQALLERTPANENISIQLTKLYLKLGRRDEARRAALTRSFSHPNSPGAHLDLLNILWQSDERSEFTREFTRYLGTFSTDPKALLLLSILAADQAQPELAQQVLTTARTGGHPPGPFLFALMQAQCAAQRYSDALETATQLDLEKDLPYRVVNTLPSLKAWAYFGLNNDAEGEVWLQRFLTQRQTNPADSLRLADSLGALGKTNAQLRLLTTLADLQPPADVAVVALLQYYAQHNMWAEAGARLPQLRAVANPPTELVETIQWHLNENTGLGGATS